jgi:hypothetical protein
MVATTSQDRYNCCGPAAANLFFPAVRVSPCCNTGFDFKKIIPYAGRKKKTCLIRQSVGKETTGFGGAEPL